MSITRQRREGAPRPHGRGHDGVQAGARGGERRRREGGRDPARQGPGEGRQARRARGGRGRRRAATSTRTAGSACSSRSTARPTSWPATTSSRSSRATSRSTSRPPAPRWVSEEDVAAEELESASARSSAQQADAAKPPEVQQKMTEGRLASGSRRSCC